MICGIVKMTTLIKHLLTSSLLRFQNNFVFELKDKLMEKKTTLKSIGWLKLKEID